MKEKKREREIGSCDVPSGYPGSSARKRERRKEKGEKRYVCILYIYTYI